MNERMRGVRERQGASRRLCLPFTCGLRFAAHDSGLSGQTSGTATEPFDSAAYAEMPHESVAAAPHEFDDAAEELH
jgi:hypothetical protein